MTDSSRTMTPSSMWSQARRSACMVVTPENGNGKPAAGITAGCARMSSGVAGLRRGDQLVTDMPGEFLPYRLHRLAPEGALLGGQVDDLGGAGGEDALAGQLVELFGLAIHLDGNLGHDLFQLAADILGQAVPETRIGNHHVVDHAMIGLGDVLLHLMHLLAFV